MPDERPAPARDPLPIGAAVVAEYRPLPSLLCVLAFLTVFAAGTWTVRRTLRSLPGVGFEDTERRAQILESFRRDGDRFDGVFIGTSRMYRGLDPTVFDTALQEAGHASRSINISGNGVRMPEALFYVDWVLRQDLEELRWLVVELGDLDPTYRARNRKGPRLINWHTTPVTLDCLDVLRDSERDLEHLWDDGVLHLTEWGYRQVSLGLGPLALDRALRGAPDVGDLSSFDGYESFDEQATRLEQRERERGPAARRSGDAAPVRAATRVGRATGLPASQARILRALVDEIRDRGVVPIFVLMPRSQHNDAVLEARERGLLSNLLDYTDPRADPGLFDPELLHDASHFNRRGAELFSERLARDVARLLREAATH